MANIAEIAGRIAALIVEGRPDLWCYGCLASKVGVSEKDARDGAQALLTRPGWILIRRSCASCGRQDDLLAQPPEAN